MWPAPPCIRELITTEVQRPVGTQVVVRALTGTHQVTMLRGGRSDLAEMVSARRAGSFLACQDVVEAIGSRDDPFVPDVATLVRDASLGEKGQPGADDGGKG
jgi:hypothetical protein